MTIERFQFQRIYKFEAQTKTAKHPINSKFNHFEEKLNLLFIFTKTINLMHNIVKIKKL